MNARAAIRAKPEHDGFTALHWAVLKKRRCQKLLLEAGADATARDSAGKTPVALGLPPPPPVKAPRGSHEQALLRAIAANPADDAPRLVYADWLLEQGNGWGEVVQLAVKLARLEPEAPERAALAKRMGALEKKHAAAFLGPIAPFVRQPRFDRGLISLVACDAQLFPQAAAAIADRAPRATLRVTGLKPKGLDALLAAPFGAFSTVVFEENRLDDAAIERLARSRGLVGVEALKLGRNPFSDRGALALAASPALSGLTSLELADIWPMTLSTSALEALVSSPHLVRLKRLSVSCSGPHIGATLAKCSAPLRELRVCDVIEFTDTDAVAVAAAQGLVGLDAIELRSAPNEHLALTDKGAKALLARARTTIDFAPKLSAAIRLRTAPLDKA